MRYEVATRQLTGSPDTPGTFVMTYTATDENGDSNTISFTIVTAESFGTQTIRDRFVGLVVGIEETCNCPGTSSEFSVDVRGRGSFLELTRASTFSLPPTGATASENAVSAVAGDGMPSSLMIALPAWNRRVAVIFPPTYRSKAAGIKSFQAELRWTAYG